MHLTKHHGLGNDFLVTFGPVDEDSAWRARALCDRRTGIGADGLIFGTITDITSADFRLFNCDGSEAEVSGNGLRCFGQALRRIVGGDDYTVDTPAGSREVCWVGEEPPGTDRFRVTMGPITVLDPPPTQAIDELGHVLGVDVGRVGYASIGNPHLVVEVNVLGGLDDERIDTAGELAQEMFDGINLHLIEVDADAVIMTPFERGAGRTEACGSGACVAATFARSWDGGEGPVRVQMPGGTVLVTPGADVVLEGPTTFVAEIIVEDGAG